MKGEALLGRVKERGDRENEMFYNLIMHKESTIVFNVLGNTLDAF
jgi:hypothetical protein